MNAFFLRWRMPLLLAFCCSLAGCSDGGLFTEPVPLRLIAGSESKQIEDILRECARQSGVELEVHYSGSVDMMLAMRRPDFEYDAVLPASSIWLRLGDRDHRRVREEASIMRSPVVLGLKRPIAQSLGWIGKDVTVADILQAVREGRLNFAMTSATQSNSGFSSYIGMLSALAGRPDVLTAEHLEHPELKANIKRLLGGVNRGSGSSGWLMESFVQDYDRLDAMFNYESMIIAANQRLVRDGRPPLFIVYPVDGLAVADGTLGFVQRPEPADNAKKKDAFVRWRNCLMSEAVQKRILQTGFRTGLIGINPAGAPAEVFDPKWGIDLGRTISPVPWPDAAVTRRARTLYQTAFRKPSLTAFALDCSGSMNSGGLDQLKNALRVLFDPASASEYFIQTGAEDITVIIPFHHGLVWEQPLVVKGNSPAALEALIRRIESLSAGGNTDIYRPVSAAWDYFASLGAAIRGYLPSVILMTDGQSNRGSLEWLVARWKQAAAGFAMPPVFSILYGEASDEQLKQLAQATAGRVFDGRTDGLDKAFREAKGYN